MLRAAGAERRRQDDDHRAARHSAPGNATHRKLTVRETVTLFRSFFDLGPVPGDAVALVQLEEEARARVGALSGGRKQRLALACALVGDPDLLFLDEPTTGGWLIVCFALALKLFRWR